MSKYLVNCFLLLLPVLLWNIAFTSKLPKGYTSKEIWDNVPFWLNTTENILRAIVFLLPLLLTFSLQAKTQKIGFGLYLVGLLIYFASWLMQIISPNSNWSTSCIGFMAPAFTTVIWFIGIGLIGQQSFVNIPRISTIYVILSIAFVIVHTYHSYLAYNQL
jgi:hypothetical protein